MCINELVKKVAKGYSDGLVLSYWDFQKETCKENHKAGDSLAGFIAKELKDTFDRNASDSQQIDEAKRVLLSAASQLESTAQALENELSGGSRPVEERASMTGLQSPIR